MYEQNIRGKSITVVVMDDFLNMVEFRPIIKYSTTTAIIDVKMDLIDAVDSSTITRQASYGMLQDQVSKYSLSLMKINLSNANIAKIYNLKNNIILGSTASNLLGAGGSIVGATSSYPVLVSANNVVAKSSNAVVGTNVFYGIGNLVIILYPFDNVITFVIANQIINNISVDFMDLTSMGSIQLTIKSQSVTVNASLYTESGSINLSSGYVAFKIVSSKINDIRKIYNSGINIFYITSTQQSTTTVIYSGLFQIYDSPSNVTSLNTTAQNQINALSATTTPLGTASAASLSGVQNGTAIVTRTLVPTYISGTSSSLVIITATGATGP
jgi:hypothetical protein